MTPPPRDEPVPHTTTAPSAAAPLQPAGSTALPRPVPGDSQRPMRVALQPGDRIRITQPMLQLMRQAVVKGYDYIVVDRCERVSDSEHQHTEVRLVFRPATDV